MPHTRNSSDTLIVELRFSLNEYELLMSLFDEARLALLWQSRVTLADLDDELRYSVIERVRPWLKSAKAKGQEGESLKTCLRSEMMSLIEAFTAA